MTITKQQVGWGAALLVLVVLALTGARALTADAKPTAPSTAETRLDNAKSHLSVLRSEATAATSDVAATDVSDRAVPYRSVRSWAEQGQRAFAATGEKLELANAHRAVATVTGAVDVLATDKSLCFRTVRAGGRGSVNCAPLEDIDSRAALLATDRTEDGMQITLLAADGTKDIAVTVGDDQPTQLPLVNNIATIGVAGEAATLQYTTVDGIRESIRLKRP